MNGRGSVIQSHKELHHVFMLLVIQGNLHCSTGTIWKRSEVVEFILKAFQPCIVTAHKGIVLRKN